MRDAIQIARQADIANLMNLARAATDSSNWQEAYDYYTTILEHEPKNAEAWLGKGTAAGWMSTLANFRFPEMLTAAKKALESSSESDAQQLRKKAALTINNVAIALFTSAGKLLAEYISLDGTWDNYVSRTMAILDALKAAHELAPDDKGIIENMIEVCVGCVEGFAYIDKFATIAKGTPQRKVRRLAPQVEQRFRLEICGFVAKMELLDPNYKPPKIKKVSAYCFVATAAAGNEHHPAVQLLREFRDIWLDNREWGRWFIDWYNESGPRLAGLVEKSLAARVICLHTIVLPTSLVARCILAAAAPRQIDLKPDPAIRHGTSPYHSPGASRQWGAHGSRGLQSQCRVQRALL